MTRHEISNSDDVIDSRDVIARIEELQGELDALREAVHDAASVYDEKMQSKDESEDAIDEQNALDEARQALKDFEDGDDGAELKALFALQEDAQNCSGWEDGEALIRESYFTEYCQEMLEDIGSLPEDFPWYIVIDWDATVNNLRADYVVADYDGVEYFIRS